MPLEPNLSIQTKSSLVVRDIDLFKKFDDCQVGMTITSLNDNIRKQIEPNTSSVKRRLSTLKQLKDSGISTYVFIGPILPHISDWQKIIEETKDYVDFYMFENLNMNGTISMDVYNWIERYHGNLLESYRQIQKNKVIFWSGLENEINQFCIDQKLDFKMYFDHKKQRKK